MAEKAVMLPANKAPSNSYPSIWAGSALPKIEDYALIRGVIQQASMVVCYGESGSTKTTHVLDRDLRIAAGLPWYDRETQPGGGLVVYVAAEGAHSVINRVHAYLAKRLPEGTDTPLLIVPSPIDLLSPEADTPRLIDWIRRVQDEHGLRCVKVTVDTLSRAMAGGNENAPEDMTAVVRNADRIRNALNACVELVHHAGKDAAKGARGHSSLRAATDTEIEVSSSNGYCVAKVTKQRDYQAGAEFAYRLEVVELGKDGWGHPVTTCLPTWVEDHAAKAPYRSLPDQGKRLLWLIREGIEIKGQLPPTEVMKGAEKPPAGFQKGLSGSTLRAWVDERGGISDADRADTRERALRRHLRTLQQAEMLRHFADFYWLADKPDMGRT